jgi:hypothetical protein
MTTITATESELGVDSTKRLNMKQAQALYGLIQTFRPDWDDRKAVMSQIQDTALYSPLEASEVVALFINAATAESDHEFEDLEFPGRNSWAASS